MRAYCLVYHGRKNILQHDRLDHLSSIRIDDEIIFDECIPHQEATKPYQQIGLRFQDAVWTSQVGPGISSLGEVPVLYVFKMTCKSRSGVRFLKNMKVRFFPFVKILNNFLQLCSLVFHFYHVMVVCLSSYEVWTYATWMSQFKETWLNWSRMFTLSPTWTPKLS